MMKSPPAAIAELRANSWASAALSVAAAAMLLSPVGCDSKTRGEERTPASADREGATQVGDEPETRARRDAGPDDSESAADRDEEVSAPTSDAISEYTDELEGDGPLEAFIETEYGVITCELHEERAPRTVGNFVGLASGQKSWRHPQTGALVEDEPLYDGVVFHRVIPGFLIQSGDPTDTGSGGPGYTFEDEFDPSLSHDEPGVLSMANRGKPDTNGSQWFITLRPAPHLDGRHSVFGRCEDIDVVEQIARVPSGTDNRPTDPPQITRIRIERAEIDDADQ